MSRKRKIKVLVVDDSAVMRKLISRLLNEDSEIEVVATAIDGDFAISKIDQMRPDVVTLDVDMPRMDGIATLGQIMSKHRIPVLMLSSLTTRGASLTMKALEMGAVDFICKPRSAARVGDLAEELIQKVKAAARSTIPTPSEPPLVSEKPKKARPLAETDAAAGKIVAIGASSGGPNALRHVLPRIPADFGAGIVVVQHLPESFTAIMAKWLDEICQLEVREAKPGDLILPGRALIAPGNMHLKVKKGREGNFIVLEQTAPVGGHMPSVDVFFRSVAQEYGPRATAVIMTGMGSDGADAIGEVKRAGGLTIAQDKASCAIFGMPKAAIDRGHIERVISLNDLANYLVTVVGRLSRQEVFDGARIQ